MLLAGNPNQNQRISYVVHQSIVLLVCIFNVCNCASVLRLVYGLFDLEVLEGGQPQMSMGMLSHLVSIPGIGLKMQDQR